MTQQRVLLFSAVLCVLIIQPLVYARQSTTSTVVIKVTDHQNNPIPQAHVRLVPYPRELSRKLVTNSQGLVTAQIGRGQYEVFADAANFESASKKFEMTETDRQTVPIALRVGASSGVEIAISTRSSDEEQIWQLENSFWKLVANLECDKYEDLWAGNAVAERDDSLGIYLIGKKDATHWLRRYRAGGLELYHYSLRGGEIRVIGDTAVAYYNINTLWLDELGRGKPRWQRVAHTWARTNGRWQIIGEFTVDTEN